MLPGKTPKQLHEVSGLFLSREKSRSVDPPARPEVTVCLAVLGDELCRAFVASGIGAAFAAQGINVSLLEIGVSLPNVGYYFALEAAGYLSLTLDSKAVIQGSAGSALRYFSAREPGLLKRSGGGFRLESAPHLIVAAFDSSLPHLEGAGLQVLLDASSNFRRSKIEGSGTHAASIIFAGGKGVEAALNLANRFTYVDPEAPVFFACEPGVGSNMKVWNNQNHSNLITLELPSSLWEGLARKVPPTGKLFQEIVVNLLQVVSSRRKREKLNDRI